MYIKENLSYKEVFLQHEGNNLYEECLLAEIKLNKNDSALCANIYRRGESSPENYELLLSVLKEISGHKNKQIQIMGDFNLKDINWEN